MKQLDGKKIVLCVTGSIAAVETVKLIHSLRRSGADVQPVMTNAACGIIHPDALTYASGNQTITRISGFVEHVQYCGDEGLADLLIIAPATANTISKIATGIDDTPVTTFATTALGRKMPILLVPAMHHAMFRHQAVLENLTRLKNWGIEILGPRIEEGKAKITNIDDIVLYSERLLSGKPLAGKKVVITSGRCEEPVDDVRILTTRSSGKMGRELAREAFRLGAEVTIIHHDTLPFGKNISITTAFSMEIAVKNEIADGKTDIYISAAAISDFAPKKIEGKIPSGKEVTIPLHPLPKILDYALSRVPYNIAFKLGESSISDGKSMLSEKVTMVVANKPDTLGADSGLYSIIDSFGIHEHSGTKQEIAINIFNRLLTFHISSVEQSL